jgi:hypothetical protein
MFKVIHQGVEIHCETADEAVQIAERLAGTSTVSTAHGRSHASGQSLAGSRWTVSRFQTLMGQLQDKQRRFLREVVASPDGLTDSALRQSLTLSSNKAFGPILTGISRRAKKVGVSLQDVLTSEKMALAGGEQFLEFKAAPAFVAVAREAGGIK